MPTNCLTYNPLGSHYTVDTKTKWAPLHSQSGRWNREGGNRHSGCRLGGQRSGPQDGFLTGKVIERSSEGQKASTTAP
jgi:hypothetical protein